MAASNEVMPDAADLENSFPDSGEGCLWSPRD